jgi:FdrA protein
MADFRDLFGCDRLGGEIRVINLGLESFAATLEGMGVPVLHVLWTPPAGGDPERARLLSLLEDEDET